MAARLTDAALRQWKRGEVDIESASDPFGQVISDLLRCRRALRRIANHNRIASSGHCQCNEASSPCSHDIATKALGSTRKGGK